MDATKAGTNSDSYATIDEADLYLETQYGADSWALLTDDQKEAALITATRCIDRLRVKHPKSVDTQKLKFPVQATNDGFDEAREATIIQGHFLNHFSDELQEAEENRIQGIKNKTIGSSLSQSMNGLNPVATMASEALNILGPYIDLTLRATR